ncbi:Zn(II)2Cys6 transcription factor [Phyllosticta citrichinensis]|uniref:Zn(II)2Cys6 transcription factor n=1 Tax=Phyllosticta citrichinensis TaxID=1130410 RepID=A0ABR1Y7Y2_9PEZI
MYVTTRLHPSFADQFHVKGDEVKPTCTRCTKHGDACEWDNRIIFRHSGLNGDHQAMRMGSQATPPVGDLTIINVTSAVSQTCRRDEPSPQDHQPSSQHQNNWKQHEPSAETLSPYQSRPSDGASPRSHAPLANLPFPPATALPDAQRLSYISPVATETPSSVRMKRQTSDINTILNGENRQLPRPERMPPTDHFSTGNSLYTTPMSTPVPVPSEDAHQPSSDFVSPLSAGELAALDFLTSQPQSALHEHPLSDQDKTWMSPDVSQEASSAFSEQLLVESPNGLYYPSSAYRDLQQDLHTHIVETARNSGLTRHATPEASAEAHMEHSRAPPHAETVSGATDRLESLARHPRATGLTDQREIELWQNYLNEIAPWLDKFDNQRHFQFTIPILAKTCTHLRYSALALSARQQERKNPSRPYTESLGLYQEAIRNLVPELETMSTSVVASSVLLCVLEMIIVSPKDWGRHLDGCAILLQAANITGVSGGVNQALFWCFARMDVWSGYLSDCCTKVPMDRWLSSNVPMSTAVNVFKNECKGFDAYANYAVFLSASVVNVINGRGDIFTNHEKRAEYIARWRALFDLVEDWFSSRPVEMVPLFSYPAAFDNYEFPFPKVLYGNAPATNGNQLYHFCAIRLLQEKPKEIRLGKKTGKSIIWHARQICGIAASNSHHGAWINGIQPLFVAGKLMSHPSEHRAILKIFKRIEEESGWATKWRADELQEYWGTEM